MAKQLSKDKAEIIEILRTLTLEQKDKLLLKLFRKDPMLVEKLAFEFFEDKSDLRQRVENLKQTIDEYLSASPYNYDTPGEIMMSMRGVNGRITEHVKITKDKYGEVELTILLLNRAFELRWNTLVEKMHRADTFTEYVLKRTQTVLKNLSKLHPDNLLDFKDELNRLLTFIHKYPRTAKTAAEFGIPKPNEW